jgi:hypothetical protein
MKKLIFHIKMQFFRNYLRKKLYFYMKNLVFHIEIQFFFVIIYEKTVFMVILFLHLKLFNF